MFGEWAVFKPAVCVAGQAGIVACANPWGLVRSVQTAARLISSLAPERLSPQQIERSSRWTKPSARIAYVFNGRIKKKKIKWEKRVGQQNVMRLQSSSVLHAACKTNWTFCRILELITRITRRGILAWRGYLISFDLSFWFVSDFRMLLAQQARILVLKAELHISAEK